MKGNIPDKQFSLQAETNMFKLLKEKRGSLFELQRKTIGVKI